MFKNFKLPDFLSALSFGQEGEQQSVCNQKNNNFSNEKSHNMKSFYADFLLLETKNQSKPQFAKSQSKTSQFGMNEVFQQQNFTHSQVIYLKRKPSTFKFVQFEKVSFDHVAIKLQIVSKARKQQLKKKLDQQLLFKQQMVQKFVNTTNSGQKSKQQFVQFPVNYYFEEVNLLCSHFSYLYIVFQKWNEGILEKLDQLIMGNGLNIRKSDNSPVREKKLSPINKIENMTTSMCLGRSETGSQINNKTAQSQSIIETKSIKEVSNHYIRLQITKELLKLTKSIIFSLRQQLKMNLIRQDLRICNFISITDGYQISNLLIPFEVLLGQLNNKNAFDNCHQLFQAGNNYNRMLLNLSYASPEQLSQIIKVQSEQNQFNDRQSDVRFSSLLFKLGMTILELYLFYSYQLTKKQNPFITNHQWVSIKEKVYTQDSSLFQFCNQSLLHKKNVTKIDWLILTNIIKKVQGTFNINHNNNEIFSLFLNVLKSLLNRSALQRSKTQSLLLDQCLEKIFNSPSNFPQQQNSNNSNLSHHFSTPHNKFSIRTQPSNYLPQNVTISIVRNQIPKPVQRNPSNINSIVNFPIIRQQQFTHCIQYKLPNSNSNSCFSQSVNFCNAQKNQNKNNVALITIPSSYSIERNNQGLQKSFKTPYFRQSEGDGGSFKFNSVSQQQKKELFPQIEQTVKKGQYKVNKDENDEITDRQTQKENSNSQQKSLSELPELLQQESPINKKPSALSNQSQEIMFELPYHLPESSKSNIILKVESEINNGSKSGEILIQEIIQIGDEYKNQTNYHQDFSTAQMINCGDNNNKNSQIQKALRKMQEDQNREFESKQYIEVVIQQQKQPHIQQLEQLQQGEYVSESYKGGGSYEGYVRNKKRNGYGKLCYHDGSRYEGEWLEDQMNGYGKLYYSHGQLAYEGSWIKDQFHGTGKLYNDTPTMLNDSFDYTNFNNLDQQWTYYEGQLQHDLKQGNGVIMLENGEYFEGSFYADRINGQGKFINLQGETIHGIWKDNVLVEIIYF